MYIICFALSVFEALAITVMCTDRNTFIMKKTDRFIGNNVIYAKEVNMLVDTVRTDFYILDDDKHYVYLSSKPID